MKKSYYLGILLVILIAGIAGCRNVEKNAEQKIGKSVVQNQDISVEAQAPADPAKEMDEPAMEEKMTREDNKKDTDAEVERDGILYKIENVEITKKIGARRKDSVSFGMEEADAEGNLSGAQEYIWLTLQIRNSESTEQEILLNNPIVNIDEVNSVTETAAEAIYIDPEQTGMKARERFHCKLKPGEEKTVELGYIIETVNAPDTLYYCVGDGGNEFSDPSYEFLYLGEVEDGE